MKKLIIITSAMFALGLTSCTKVIDVDLNTSDPQYVVEGNITDDGSNQVIHITRSVNFSDDNEFPAVTNAIVIVSDATDKIDTLMQDAPGYYQTSKITGVPGHTYTLRILVDGQEFVSTSTMPQLVPMDSMALVDESMFGKEIKTPVVTYRDPSAGRNYYYFRIYKNDVRSKVIYLENDFANDGEFIKTSLRDFDTGYNNGDRIRIEMQCITSAMYDYYFSLQQTMEQSSATPANPVSNISGKNVLGYFSAHTRQQRSVIVP